MSRDQKPGRSKIVNSTVEREPSAPPAPADAAPAPAAAGGARSPVVLLGALFLLACTAGGVGVAVLPWLLR